MSDALDYLLQARPEALGHYFAFLKDAGKHLDPKTRNLISVITKVHAQTERGLRQYLKRALRDGCTAVEILDALLMAFPALGLTKIVWAVDIVLAMGLPEFAQLTAPAVPMSATMKPRWHNVGSTGAFTNMVVQRLQCEDTSVFVYRKGRRYSVFDSRCPHQGTVMSESALEGSVLVCSKHQWEFDATSGRCIKNGDSPLKRFKSKVVEGRLMAFW